MAGVNEPELLHAGLNLANHPSEKQAQVESDVFGFWVFLMSDAILFALLFVVYGTMLDATAGVPAPHTDFKFSSSFLETLALLSSSFAYGMVSLNLKLGASRRWIWGWLGVTFLLGAWFLRLEIGDFTDMVAHGETAQASGALSSFFVLVGTHGLHVTCGLIWIVIMAVQLAIHDIDERVKINLIRLGLFWHFLDVVWVAIFTIVYLRGLLA
ncbi:cytochrome c oxidase subunit 3 [Acidocella facilis]|uniref:cytochrome c oxidase subunit 3 n=1 Tax=Acidocella facilis TaxID=525 RepID=UPI00047D588F|nr:cytochrome c oxidase subunit 3 [Acidocella facilis]